MKPISPKSWKLLLPCALMIGGLLPGLVAAAPPTQSFYIYGHAQVLEGRLSLATPFVGEMRVDPAFTDPSFGQIGRVTSITLSFPLLWRVPAFNTIVTQGPEISRSEEHTSELQSLMRTSYAVFCLQKKTYSTY